MGPGVTCYLMLLGYHSLDNVAPCRCRVNGALSYVVAGDEESSFCVFCCQQCKQVISVDVRTIVVGDGNISWLDTAVDSFAAVFLISELGARSVASTSSKGNQVGVASRTVFKIAIRSLTVVYTFPAISSQRATVSSVASCTVEVFSTSSLCVTASLAWNQM